MFEFRENLCESVIEQNLSQRDWQDKIYLADSCKERFIVQSELSELGTEGITMAGLAELSDGYIVERKHPEIHTLLFTQEGGGRLLTKQGIYAITPIPSLSYLKISRFVLSWRIVQIGKWLGFYCHQPPSGNKLRIASNELNQPICVNRCGLC
ncbi:hypothetical protein [Vibrio hibernica]|uniref:hypothetical protein n=1 Tax=Vibrio hibernica TaxID=2587465 RepID=UPI0039AF07E1